MVTLLNNLFFNLGLYIGLYSERVHTTMHDYLLGIRYSRSIYNPMVSLIAIKKLALFFLLSNKLNRRIIPVLSNTDTVFRVNQSFTYGHDNYNDNFVSDVLMQQLPNSFGINLYNAFAMRFFKMYRISILSNKIGLLGWWLIYYKTLVTNIYSYYRNYKKKGFKQTFSPFDFKRFPNKKLQRFFYIKKKKYNMLQILTLIIILYLKLYESAFSKSDSLKFRMGKYIRKFKKFFAFLKLLLFLRQYTIFPSILYYLNTTNAELRDVMKFRVCTLAIVNSNNIASMPLYPIPANNNNLLSKIFFSYLFVYYSFIGKILMTLSVI